MSSTRHPSFLVLLLVVLAMGSQACQNTVPSAEQEDDPDCTEAGDRAIVAEILVQLEAPDVTVDDVA
ncbi:MAG: hypothetical protein AAGF95_19935, partial [Chloroflexota bacterium]